MKICPLCGKDNKDRAEVCSSCGFNFSGTGHIPGGKRTGAPSKKKKGGKILKIAALCFAAVMLLSLTGLFVHNLRMMKWHEAFDPMIGISEGNILLYDLQRPSAKPMKIAKLEDESNFSKEYQKVYISKSRKELMFSNSFRFYDDFFSVSCDVYSYDLEALPYFPKTVLRDVTDWTVSRDFDIFTFEKASDGKMGLYQNINGEEKLVTDKYKVYSVSADGKDLAYSNNNKKLKIEVSSEEGNIRTFSLPELTASNGKITFSLSGEDITAELPEGLTLGQATLTLTEKGSALITDEKSGKVFLYRSGRFTLFSEEGEYFIIPDYPKGVKNVINYDFSVLN